MYLLWIIDDHKLRRNLTLLLWYKTVKFRELLTLKMSSFKVIFIYLVNFLLPISHDHLFLINPTFHLFCITVNNLYQLRLFLKLTITPISKLLLFFFYSLITLANIQKNRNLLHSLLILFISWARYHQSLLFRFIQLSLRHLLWLFVLRIDKNWRFYFIFILLIQLELESNLSHHLIDNLHSRTTVVQKVSLFLHQFLWTHYDSIKSLSQIKVFYQLSFALTKFYNTSQIVIHLIEVFMINCIHKLQCNTAKLQLLVINLTTNIVYLLLYPLKMRLQLFQNIEYILVLGQQHKHP